MATLNTQLNVLRVVIQPADDDQILQSSGNEAFSVGKKTKIAGAQEGTIAGICEVSAEGLFCLLYVVPVAGSDACTLKPNLADFSRRARRQLRGVGNTDLFAGKHAPAANQRILIFRSLRIRNAVHIKRLLRDKLDEGRSRLRTAGDDERGLSQTITRPKRCATKPAQGKLLRKRFERAG